MAHDLTGEHGVRGASAPLRLSPVPESAARAREYVREQLAAIGRPDLLECAELGVDELVANVCVHAHTALVVAVRGNGNGAVRIEVTDYATAPPVQQDADELETGGRGLMLLDACGRWGYGPPPDGKGKTVWFEPNGWPTDPDRGAER